jgi:hypothetical protein
MEVIIAGCIAKPFLVCAPPHHCLVAMVCQNLLPFSRCRWDTFVRPTSAVNLKLPADLVGFFHQADTAWFDN